MARVRKRAPTTLEGIAALVALPFLIVVGAVQSIPHIFRRRQQSGFQKMTPKEWDDFNESIANGAGDR